MKWSVFRITRSLFKGRVLSSVANIEGNVLFLRE
jgi:hypothetical protein